jgi:A/G-specific adenine glycosylase
MGYNRRALALKRLAEIVVRQYNGILPNNPKVLDSLPGIGWATACAIAAFAYQRAFPFIETNIRRVFIHFFFPSRRKVSDVEILALVAATLDIRNPREWYYALMDYGSYLGRSILNPNRRAASYRTPTPFEGSARQLRGKILAYLIERGNTAPIDTMIRTLNISRNQIKKILDDLAKEGFIIIRANHISLKT